jgi:hypothetical protein
MRTHLSDLTENLISGKFAFRSLRIIFATSAADTYFLIFCPSFVRFRLSA